MRGTLKLVDEPKVIRDVPAPPRRRLSDQLETVRGKTDEEMPSLAMAVIDATHRTGSILEAGRARSEAATARSGAIDALERELNDNDATWSERRARLSLRR